MSKRYWCPQAASLKGWIDLPSLAYQAKQKANDQAEKFARENKVVTRIIRKPHGWEPRAPEPAKKEILGPETPKTTSEKAPSPPEPLPEDSSDDRYRLEEETKKGNQPCAVRLSRLMLRNGEHKKLLELCINSYYMGWDQLFCEILEKLPFRERRELKSFIQQTGDQEFLHLFEEIK